MSAMRPLYSTRGLDTTPRGPRRDRRSHKIRRVAYDAFQMDFGFWEGLFVSFGMTLLFAVAIWGISDLIQGLRHL